MELGDLTFKPEDFYKYTRPERDELAEMANKLLSERLERAQKVFYGSYGAGSWSTTPGTADWSTARLVCIKPIKGGGE